RFPLHSHSARRTRFQPRRRRHRRIAESRAMTSGEGLSVRGLTTTFATRHGAAIAVDRIDLDVSPGEVVGLVGESGSGKSMTLRSIVRLVHEPGKVEGQVFWQ